MQCDNSVKDFCSKISSFESIKVHWQVQKLNHFSWLLAVALFAQNFQNKFSRVTCVTWFSKQNLAENNCFEFHNCNSYQKNKKNPTNLCTKAFCCDKKIKQVYQM